MAEVGVSASEIVIGQTGDRSAGIKEYTFDLTLGLTVYFNKLNAEGGVHGRKIRIESRDDGYDPKRTVEAVTDLIDHQHVFAILSSLGTPTIKASLPYIEKMDVPFLFPYSGGESSRLPSAKTSVNLRAGYAEEIERLLEYTVKDLNTDDIGIFYQNDALGDSGVTALEAFLDKRNKHINGHGKYQRNSEDVSLALDSLIKAKPKAVFLQCVRRACVAFLKAAAAKKFTPIILANSLGSISDALADIPTAKFNLVISEILPSPHTQGLRIAREFSNAMTLAGHSDRINYVTFEGYLDAKVLTTALRSIDKDLNRKSLMTAFENMKNKDIGGITLSFSPKRRQLLNEVYLYRVENGSAKLISQN